MNVTEVIASIRGGLGQDGPDAAGQGLVAGDGAAQVRRLLVCQSPSVAVLRVAAAKPGTLVIAREHPYYLHDESVWSARVDTELLASNDPVVAGKKAIIEAGGVAVYRLSRAWDAAHPKAQAEALAETLGWKTAESGSGRKAVCDIAPVALETLARQVKERLEAGHVRVTGARDARISRVALLPEFISIVEARELMAATPLVDGIVCGESCEWEAAVYLKDTFDMRRAPISLIFAGTQPTQEPGVRAMHGWIAKRFKKLAVAYQDIARPVRNLEELA
ncbi:MAG: hypothetical protein CVT83_04780 [Alphaproteobacteria bacterium HGW-Alphaproteobacteria-5]|jgi:putative NIF3 family GTP cyclohydrolase 1 type 2|nr:MAG: hypothetical protein CVT83_04780 [Alphaproteobacteria bacterium HGW-Alphaproteobacteria-5]